MPYSAPQHTPDSEKNKTARKRFIHPAAELFPMMDEQQFAVLKEDIQKNGLREPVVLDIEGAVVDGRNRLRACDELGIEPKFVNWTGGDTIGFVMSLNMARRHLTESQRAMIAAKAKGIYEERAAARRRATQNNNSAGAVRANLRELETGKASAHAARALNVSPRSVETASKVLKTAVPEVVAMVEKGQLSVSAAAVVAQQQTQRQIELAAAKEIERQQFLAHHREVLRKRAEREEAELLKQELSKMSADQSQNPTSGPRRYYDSPDGPDPRLPIMLSVEEKISGAIDARADHLTSMLESIQQQVDVVLHEL